MTAGVCAPFLLDLLDGEHQPGDDYRIALIRKGAAGSFGPGTRNYSDLGAAEVEGPGYQAGGRSR